MRLLFVEDEDAIRTPVLRLLTRWGHEVREAASAQDAEELLKTFQPDGALCDMKLPDGTGLEVALRAGVPFVLMSGYATFDDLVLAMRHGCVDFLTKPVPMKVLRRSLEALETRVGLQRASGTGGVLVRDADGSWQRCLRTPRRIIREPLEIFQHSWLDAGSAQAAFEAFTTFSRYRLERQVAAELIPCAQRGSLAVQREGGCTRLLLRIEERAKDGEVPLPERLQLLRSLCRYWHTGAMTHPESLAIVDADAAAVQGQNTPETFVSLEDTDSSAGLWVEVDHDRIA
jgi:DNA-binding response OmpR family regulator